MQGWVILEHPALMLVYGAALLLCLLEKKWRKTKGVFFICPPPLPSPPPRFDS